MLWEIFHWNKCLDRVHGLRLMWNVKVVEIKLKLRNFIVVLLSYFYYYCLFVFWYIEVTTSWQNCWVLTVQVNHPSNEEDTLTVFHLNKDGCRYVTKTPNFPWIRSKQQACTWKKFTTKNTSVFWNVNFSWFLQTNTTQTSFKVWLILIFLISEIFFIHFWGKTCKTRSFLWQRDWREVIKQDWLFQRTSGHMQLHSATSHSSSSRVGELHRGDGCGARKEDGTEEICMSSELKQFEITVWSFT